MNGLTIVSILRCTIIHKTIYIVTEIYFDIGKDKCGTNLFILNNYISFLHTEICNRRRNRENDNNKK